MRIFFIILALASFRSYANTTAQCELVDGLYKNSTIEIADIHFGTLVDVFTLGNANTLNINLDGNHLKYIRSAIAVNRQTKMIYQQKKNSKVFRTIHVMIDRTPKEVVIEREFYGNMIILPEEDDVLSSRSLVYNFHCRF
jgi:hypothetical protein